METFVYKPKGVCSQQMRFTIDQDRIDHVEIVGGCAGNLLGISKMLEGKTIEEIITVFDGVKCGRKRTSCPDQIASALREYLQGKV